MQLTICMNADIDLTITPRDGYSAEDVLEWLKDGTAIFNDNPQDASAVLTPTDDEVIADVEVNEVALLEESMQYVVSQD